MFDILKGINVIGLRWCYEQIGAKLCSENDDQLSGWRNSTAEIWDESCSAWWLSLLMVGSYTMEYRESSLQWQQARKEEWTLQGWALEPKWSWWTDSMVWRKQAVLQQGQGRRQTQLQELQLLAQGEQNWVGSSALRDLYSMACVASGQQSSENIRIFVHLVPALGWLLRRT